MQLEKEERCVMILKKLDNALTILNVFLLECREEANEDDGLVKLINQILYGEVCQHNTDICGGTIRAEKRVRYRKELADLESIPTREENDEREIGNSSSAPHN